MEDSWAFIWGKKEVRAFEFVQPNVTKLNMTRFIDRRITD